MVEFQTERPQKFPEQRIMIKYFNFGHFFCEKSMSVIILDLSKKLTQTTNSSLPVIFVFNLRSEGASFQGI